MKRLPWLLPLVFVSCVSLEELHIPRGGILKDQRTVLAVYAGPGPVMSQQDNKAESAAKITPGIALMVQASQDERDNAASKDLAQYLPPWDAAGEFERELAKLLAGAGHPGRFITPSEGGIAPAQMALYNRASDLLDWRLRYFIQNPDHPVPRNYSTQLQLDDALVFEANLVYGVAEDDQQNATPTLACVTKLFRANTMHLLWRHEDFVEDQAGKRLLYDFKRDGQDLINKYRKLVPSLAQKVAESYKKELQAAELYLPPVKPASLPATPAVSGSTEAPRGWFAVPELPGMSTGTAKAPFAVPEGVSMSTTTAAQLGLPSPGISTAVSESTTTAR